jgi:hypothetical protein
MTDTPDYTVSSRCPKALQSIGVDRSGDDAREVDFQSACR